MKKQTKKKERNWKQIFSILLLLIFSGIVIYVGFGLIDAIPNFSLWDIIFGWFVFFLSFPLHILLHEAGHLIAGFLSGYQFVMLRLFNWVWIKTEQGISRRKQAVPGLLGQALMLPPVKAEKAPLLFYHSGGLLLNLFTILLFILIGGWSANPRVAFYLFISGGVAFLFLIANSLPRKGTDGYNLIQLYKRPETLAETTTVLRLYGGMVQGKSFAELQRYIPQNLPTSFENPNTVTLYTAQAAVYFETGNFEKARKIYETLWLNRKQLIQLHKPEVYLTYLFSLLLTDPAHQDVGAIQETAIYKNMVETKAPDSYKILAAEAIYLENDLVKAKELLSEGKPLLSTAPTVTEEKLERQLYKYLEREIKILEKKK